MADPELVHRMGVAVRELRRGTAQDLRDRLYGDVVDLAQADALEVLAIRGPRKMSELAAELRVDASAATRTVRRLADAGLIERSTPESDGRAVVVSLSDEGWRVCAELGSRGRAAMALLLDEFEQAEQEQLASLLERFVRAIGDRRRRDRSTGQNGELRSADGAHLEGGGLRG
jgi:DNA-binding MarR family transcriptional regulator